MEAARFDELQHVGQRQPVVPRLELRLGTALRKARREIFAGQPADVQAFLREKLG